MAVQKGLDGLIEKLKDKGYEVVDIETYNYPIDAMIYEGSVLQISHHVSYNNMPMALKESERGNYGVLMINSSGKSFEEIEYILKNRCYSPLF